jgi:hypothetical protein
MKHLLVPSVAFFSLTFSLFLGHARAQTRKPPAKPSSDESVITAKEIGDPADVSSIDRIIAALYDVISGPAGRKRDWERMRTLFVPGARLMPTSPQRPIGTPANAPLTGDEEYATHVLDVDGYIARASKFLEEEGFFEHEIARRMETYGHIAHVWSTYEGRRGQKNSKPFVRGVNSIQLMNDGRRWWVVSVFWEAETPKTPLPKKYLKRAR